MSVIFGIKESGRIIIAGDKRGSSIDGKILSDNLDKILVVNNHLAFASAGNAAIEKTISMDLNKVTNKDDLSTDDLLDIIKAFYQRVIDTNCNGILSLPFYFLIAGKGRSSNASLISGGNIKGRLDAKEFLWLSILLLMQKCRNVAIVSPRIISCIMQIFPKERLEKSRILANL